MIDNLEDLNAKWGSEEFRAEAEKEGDRNYPLIPDNAKAPARIEKMEIKEYDGAYYINVRYKLTGGAYTGRVLFQKFKIFNRDETGEKHRLKLAKFYNACELPKPTGLPAVDEALFCFEGKELGLCIGIFNEYQCIKWFAKLNDKFQIDNQLEEVKEEWKPVPAVAPAPSGAIDFDADIPF